MTSRCSACKLDILPVGFCLSYSEKMFKGLCLLLLLVTAGQAQYGQSSRPVNRGPPGRFPSDTVKQVQSEQYATTTVPPAVYSTEAASTTYIPQTQPTRPYNPTPNPSRQVPYQQPANTAYVRQPQPAAPKYTEPAPPQYQEKPAPPQYQEKPAPPQYQEKPAPPQYQEKPAPVQYQERPVAPPRYEPQPQKPVPAPVPVYSPAPAQAPPRRPVYNPAPAAQAPPQPAVYQQKVVAATQTIKKTEEPDVNTLPGIAGKDYPIYSSIPRTGFSCSGKIAGYYADVDANCQAWHYCSLDGLVDSFLCTNGTVYSQETRVCDWWYNVDCSQTSKNFDVNKDLYIIPEPTKPPTTVLKSVESYAPTKPAVEQRPTYDAPQKAPVTVYENPSYGPAPAAAAVQSPPRVNYQPEAPQQKPRGRPAPQRPAQQQPASAGSYY